MNHFEIDNNGGTINIYMPPKEQLEKKKSYTGDGMGLMFYGCTAMLSAMMLEAAFAWVAVHAVAIGATLATGAAGTAAVVYRRKLVALLPARPVTALPEPVRTVAALPAPEPAPVVQISPAAQQRIAVLRNTGYTLTQEDEAAVERLVRVEEQRRREEAWA